MSGRPYRRRRPGDPADAFIREYASRRDVYGDTARWCAQWCETLLESSGIRAIVTRRAKDPQRLREKLERHVNRHGRPCRSRQEVRQAARDLAGVRIALYFPGDRDRVEALIRQHFVLSQDTPKKFPGQAGEASPADYDPRFPGYCAVHYHVRPELGRQPRTRTGGDAPAQPPPVPRGGMEVEIQIGSLLMHAWSEVQHDLIYKRLTGQVSALEHKLVDQLNGLVLTGEMVLEQLQSTLEQRQAESEQRFADRFELSAYLLQFLDSVPPSPFERSLGRIDVLLGFLRRAGLDRGPALEGHLAEIPDPTHEKSMSEQLARAILRRHPELKQHYADAWLESGDIHRSAVELVRVLLDGEGGVARFGRVVVSKGNYWNTLFMDEFQARYLDEHPEIYEQMQRRADDIFGKLPPRRIPAPSAGSSR